MHNKNNSDIPQRIANCNTNNTMAYGMTMTMTMRCINLDSMTKAHELWKFLKKK